jgi:hypothetical protein
MLMRPYNKNSSVSRQAVVRKKHNRIKAALLVALAAFVIALALLLIVNKKHAPLGANELKIKTADLRSFAAESSFIAEQALAGRLVANFFHVHTTMLEDKTGETAKALEAARPRAGLEHFYIEASALANDTADEVAVLPASFENEEALADAKDKLASLAPRMLKLENDLASDER